MEELAMAPGKETVTKLTTFVMPMGYAGQQVGLNYLSSYHHP